MANNDAEHTATSGDNQAPTHNIRTPIVFRTGNILRSDADAICIPVNCVGVAGAGLAKAWANADPAAAHIYRSLCKGGAITPGSVAWLNGTPWALCATKDNWRHSSKAVWVNGCLLRLRGSQAWGSLAVPYLGAGLGGLSEDAVRQAIEEAFAGDVRRVEVWSYGR